MVSTAEQQKQHSQRAGFTKASSERYTFHERTDMLRAFSHKKNMQCFQPHCFIGAVSVGFCKCSIRGSVIPADSWQHLCYHAREVLTLGCPTAQRFHVSLSWICLANFWSQGPSRKIWTSQRHKIHSLVTTEQISYVAPINKCCTFSKN